MKIFSETTALRTVLQAERHRGRRIALVPTMGNIHRGHLALVETAHSLADLVVVSIFVNPLQFGPGEDFRQYPRTPEADHQQLAAAGVSCLYTPDVIDLYPNGTDNQTLVRVPGDNILCGAVRPQLFSGAATVVLKLFNIIQPHCAVFGCKDYQQLVLIRRMVADLNMDITICPGQTVREADGLALSSRNRYMTEEQRQCAPTLYQVLCKTAQNLQRGEPNIAAVTDSACENLQQAGLSPRYFECRDADSLGEIKGELHNRNVVICASVTIGNIFLIDNVTFSV